jgi:hypothetical protein
VAKCHANVYQNVLVNDKSNNIGSCSCELREKIYGLKAPECSLVSLSDVRTGIAIPDFAEGL